MRKLAFGEIVGQSQAMQRVLEQVDLVAPPEATVLIQAGVTQRRCDRVAFISNRHARGHSMPERLGLYRTVLRYDRPSGSGVALAEALEPVSHDRLTRRRQRDWSGQTLLELACRSLCGWPRGSLSLDATVIPEPFATAIEGLAWVFSSPARTPVDGLSLVLLVWPHGPAASRSGCDWGARGVRPSGSWRWRCSALRAITRAVALRPCSLTPGIPPEPCCSGCTTRVVCHVPAEKDSSRQWPRGPVPPAASLLGRQRRAEWGPARARGQIRQQVLCHPLLDAGGRGGAPPVLQACPHQRRESRLQGSPGADGLSSALGEGATPPITCCLIALWVLERERDDRQLSFKGRDHPLPALERLRITA